MTDTSMPGDVNINLDLDAYERPAEEVTEPFVSKVGGRLITMIDPEDFDWQDLLEIDNNPVSFLRYCLNDDDREHLRNQSMKAWKLNKLMEDYMKHYGIDKKIKQYEREQSGRGL